MGRGAEFNDRVKEARRKTIFETAVKLFAVNGLAGTKISRIASDAGMSQGLMYHYFRSKEEIYVALIRHAFSRMNTAVRALEALPVTAREKIETAIVQLLHGFDALRGQRILSPAHCPGHRIPGHSRCRRRHY